MTASCVLRSCRAFGLERAQRQSALRSMWSRVRAVRKERSNAAQARPATLCASREDEQMWMVGPKGEREREEWLIF